MSLQPIRGVEGSDYINASFVDVSAVNVVDAANLLDFSWSWLNIDLLVLFEVCFELLTTCKAARYIISVVFISMCVCLSDDNFRKPWRRKFIFARRVYLEGMRVRFVYEGHRVKVKVTGAKKVENPYSHKVKLRSAVTPVIEPWSLHVAWGFQIWPIEWCDCRLCHVTGSDCAQLNACIRGWSAID